MFIDGDKSLLNGVKERFYRFFFIWSRHRLEVGDN
jgi:hypothetical protein